MASTSSSLSYLVTDARPIIRRHKTTEPVGLSAGAALSVVIWRRKDAGPDPSSRADERMTGAASISRVEDEEEDEEEEDEEDEERR